MTVCKQKFLMLFSIMSLWSVAIAIVFGLSIPVIYDWANEMYGRTATPLPSEWFWAITLSPIMFYGLITLWTYTNTVKIYQKDQGTTI